MKVAVFNGRKWPNTGRSAPDSPPDLKLEIFNIHKPWDDLCWWDEKRQLWVYLSTLPHQS